MKKYLMATEIAFLITDWVFLYFKESKPLLRISNFQVNDFAGEIMVVALKFNDIKKVIKQIK